MAGPWEDYAAPGAGPWLDYQGGEEPVEQEALSRSVPRGMLQGVTLGFGDEIAGALGGTAAMLDPSLPGATAGERFSKAYQGIRGAEHEATEAFRENRPGLAFGTELAGGIMTGGLGAGRAMATQTGKRLAANMAARPLRQRLAMASGTGAVAGGVAGSGEAPTMADIPEYAGRGALVGAAAGPVAEVGATGVQKVAGAARRAMNPTATAEKRLRSTLADAGMTEQQAAARLKKLGDEAILADVSEATRLELETLAQRPGATAGKVGRQLTQRSGRQADEILEPFGAGRQLEAIDNLKAFRQTTASPLYERAFEKGVDHNQALREVFEDVNELDPSLWRQARRQGLLQFRNKGERLAPEAMGTDVAPSLRGWQALKERLDDMEGVARRKGENKFAADVGGLRRRLLSELDEQNPDYRKAREMWAGTMEFEEMMDQGRKFLREPSNVATKAIQEMTPAQKDAYRIGVAQEIQNKVEKMGDTHDVSKLFNNPGIRKKLEALFDTRKGFREFKARVLRSREKQRTMSQALPGAGSRTARALLADRDQMQQAVGDFAGDVIQSQGGVVGPTANLAARSLRGVRGPRRATRDALGTMLLEGNPQAQAQILQSVFNPAPLPRTTGAGLLAPALLGGGAGLLATR